MPKRILISRPVPNTISLAEWLAYVAASLELKPVALREGINPFTRKPQVFHPAPGSVYFDTPAGRCSISFSQGHLTADVHNEAAMAVIEQIAANLQAAIADVPEQ